MTLPKKILPNSVVHFRDIPQMAMPFFVADSFRRYGRTILCLVNDLGQAKYCQQVLSDLLSDESVLLFPEWNTVPYDRLSPEADRMGQRIATLSHLVLNPNQPRVILAPVWAVFQKIMPQTILESRALELSVGQDVSHDTLVSFLADNGYSRVAEVMEVGEFSVRGSLIDIFPSGQTHPIRLDFFDTEIETIKTFHPLHQRTEGTLKSVMLFPTNEVVLTDATVANFRQNYRGLLTEGHDLTMDEFYMAISEKRLPIGAENYLPLFYEKLDTLFDYLSDETLIIEPAQIDFIGNQFHANVRDYFNYRLNESSTFVPPFSPEKMYASVDDIYQQMEPFGRLSFQSVQGDDATYDSGFDPLPPLHIDADKKNRFLETDLPIVFAGSSERFSNRLRELVGDQLPVFDSISAAVQSKKNCLLTLDFDRGFSSERFHLVTENDLFQTKQKSQRRRLSKRAKQGQFIDDFSTLEIGDIIVHIEHGIGRYDGLHTLTIGEQPHDFLKLIYAGGGSLFVPVEQMDVLSKYGSASEGLILDRLGSSAWQERKARVKRKLKMMASSLIQTAAKRLLAKAPVLPKSTDLDYDKFVHAFPHVETDDQLNAVDEIVSDFELGRPMDRLLCADVGYGKTEVAFRAAFLAMANGYQVAMVVPTTLLAEQHLANARERFKDFPFRIEKLSRAVSAANAKKIKADLADGKVDLIVGTHSLFAGSVAFKNLGLLIVDEEQSFGVAHKEKIKHGYPSAHQLTLTATPIPRTLQLSLAGVRELSVMTTAPAARLPVLTHLIPFDPLSIKDAIVREKSRGGQVFMVCPRIQDLHSAQKELLSVLPDLKITIGHGQMGMRGLEMAMEEFASGETDLLLSTTIIESGLDLPNVNTMIIYRADRFGLATLYQLRGRIGRRQRQAYCYLTYPREMKLSDQAKKRLEVIHTLSGLGAGFQLASYDLDIRGAGNLLGAEQSGHIKEVGIELYQKMLEEMIQSMKHTLLAEAGDVAAHSVQDGLNFVPKILAPIPMIIPSTYVESADLRLELYQRLAHMRDADAFDDFEAELADRFGRVPTEVVHLIRMSKFKERLRRMRIAELDVSRDSLTLRFYENRALDPDQLIEFILNSGGVYRVLPDQRVLYSKVKSRDVFELIEDVLSDLESVFGV